MQTKKQTRVNNVYYNSIFAHAFFECNINSDAVMTIMHEARREDLMEVFESLDITVQCTVRKEHPYDSHYQWGKIVDVEIHFWNPNEEQSQEEMDKVNFLNEHITGLIENWFEMKLKVLTKLHKDTYEYLTSEPLVLSALKRFRVMYDTQGWMVF